MLFKQVKYFMAIAEAGSFSEGAAQCFISQSGISQQISALEAELDVQLLERTPRGVILTDAGRYLYENAKVLLAQAEKLKKGVRAAAHLNDKRLSISYVNGSTPDCLPQALCFLKKRHADIAVNVYGTGYLAAFSDLAGGRADLVLAARSVPEGDNYDSIYLGSWPCYAGISSMFSTGPQAYLTAADLRELPCIIVAENDEREAEQRYYRKFFGVRNYCLFAAGEEEAELMAAAGSGFILTDNDFVRPGIKKIPFYAGGSRVEKKYYLYTDKWFNKNVQDFIDIITGLCGAPQDGKEVE